MSSVMYVVCWLLLAAIFIVIEIISLGLTTIWFAGGAFIAALAGLAGANLIVQVVLFAVVSVALLVLTRPLAKKYLDSRTEKTNAEALIGQNAVVLEEVNNLLGTGRAKINGMEWTARSQDDAVMIPEGAVASIVEIQGVKLILQKVSGKPEDIANSGENEAAATMQPDDIQIV
ncbi:MAG: NfeD family protein [Clostridium sp.]|nr:NfeD family protein [Clostridium sp.]